MSASLHSLTFIDNFSKTLPEPGKQSEMDRQTSISTKVISCAVCIPVTLGIQIMSSTTFFAAVGSFSYVLETFW